MTTVSDYTVLVDFHSSRDYDVIEAQFAHADFVEVIGADQYQVGFGVHAPNAGEAYRRAVNAVTSSMAMLGVTEPAILGASVQPPNGDEPVVFG